MAFPKKLLLILILALVIRSYPITIGSMTGPDPWFHARMSELVVSEEAVPSYDEFSMQGRSYSYAPLFHTTIASFSLISGIEVLALTPLLPLLYGAMAVFIVFVLTKRFTKSESLSLFAALAIAIMPLHLMRSSAYARPDTLALLLVPSILFLIYTKRFVPAAILTVALVLLHPLSTLYLFLLLIAWMIVAKVSRTPTPFVKIVSLLLMGTLVWLVWLYFLPYSPFEYLSPTIFESSENAKPILLNLFTFFTFSWVFLLIGFAKMGKRANIFLVSWIGFSLLYAAFSSRLAIFLTIPVAVIAAFGFKHIFEKTRQLAPFLFLIFFTVIAVTVVGEASGIGFFVSTSARDAMSWLETSPPDSVVANFWDRGHPLTYIARRPVVIDGYFEFAPGLEERNESIMVIASTSNCEKLRAEVDRWGADFFFVSGHRMDSVVFENGLFEADCNFISRPFAGDGAIIIGFD